MARLLHRLVCTRDHRLVVDLLFEPRDLWWGIFWRSYRSTASRRCLHVYVCMVPTLPLRLTMALWRVRMRGPVRDDHAGGASLVAQQQEQQEGL